MNHGIILHEEYRERMKKFSPERLGKLVHNMFLVDDGLEPESFPDDEALDVLSEVICARLKRDIELSDRQRAKAVKGGAPIGNQNAKKQSENKQKTTRKQPKNNPKQPPITNNQLPITNNKDIYGEAKNVLLTKEEYEKIKSKGYTELIEELSLYMASKKKAYADHYMTILAWGRRREKEHKDKVVPQNQFNTGYERSNNEYDYSKLIKN